MLVSFTKSLPKTPTGKVIKAELKTRSNADAWDREALTRPRAPANPGI